MSKSEIVDTKVIKKYGFKIILQQHPEGIWVFYTKR